MSIHIPGSPLCSSCPLSPIKPVLGSGSKQARLLILGEAPGWAEELDGRLLSGYGGHVIRGALNYLRIPKSEVYISSALACKAPQTLSGKDWRKALQACLPRLQHEISQLPNLKAIFAIGKQALWVATGKTNIRAWAGAPLNADGILGLSTPVLPSFWPANPAEQWVVRRYLARAWALAQGKLTPWVWPNFQLHPNEAMVAELERLLHDGGPVAVDVETQGIDPLSANLMCLGLADQKGGISTPWHAYDSVKYGVSPAIETFPLGAKVKQLVSQILANPNIQIVGHNLQHDFLSLQYHGLPIIGPTADTLLAHHAAFPQLRHDLGYVSAIEFHAPRWKSEFKIFDDAKGLEAFVQRPPEELRAYNIRDAYMTALLWGTNASIAS